MIIQIHLADVNDHTPKFDRTVYTAAVSENQDGGTFVIKVCEGKKLSFPLQYCCPGLPIPYCCIECMLISSRAPYISTLPKVKATDADEGINGELTYDLPLGIAEDKFRVDSRTGRITTTGPLDRESKSIYTLTVSCELV